MYENGEKRLDKTFCGRFSIHLYRYKANVKKVTEMLTEVTAGARADVYSLGIVHIL